MITELLNLDLTKELDLESLSQENQKELTDKMLDVLESRINLEVLATLDEDGKKELDIVLDSNGDMLSFLKSKIPNFDIMVAETVANFKKEIVSLQ